MHNLSSLRGAATLLAAMGVFCVVTVAAAPAFQTELAPGPALRIAMTHHADFMQGQAGAAFTITVANQPSAGSTSGTVTVTDILPGWFTFVSMTGEGWTCTLNSCGRDDALAGGASYPPITLTVDVSRDAPSEVVNVAMAGGGGSDSAVVGDTVAVVVPTVFADVPSTDPFAEAIVLMGAHRITNGCSADPLLYCPNDPVTRGQMAVFVVRSVMGDDSFAYQPVPHFTDVAASHPFFKWIQKLQELGITSGCGNSSYCPDSLVTRAQMAAFILKARLGTSPSFNYSNVPLFADVPATNPFFVWIQKLKLLGITQGCSATEYCPESPVTRGQMAVFLMRGVFNLLMPADTAMITSVTPASAPRGQTLAIRMTGVSTHFVDHLTYFWVKPGVTVISVTVEDASTISARINIATDAEPGPRTLCTMTNMEEAVLPNGFRIE
jgi:uncharacterized repeat protein (TIGR01451 family)